MNNIYSIFKYPLKLEDSQCICGRISAVLDIQIQNGTPVLWAIIDEKLPEESITICMFPTGKDVISSDIGENLFHIATTQHAWMVWHWFVKLKP